MSNLFMRYTLLLALGLSVSACSGSGSCFLSSGAGFDTCKDYLGSQFDQSVAQNDCSNLMGVHQSDPCSTTGALGFCTVWGSSTAINFRYTYSAAADGSDAGTVSTVTLQSACGIAGGTFSTTE